MGNEGYSLNGGIIMALDVLKLNVNLLSMDLHLLLLLEVLLLVGEELHSWLC
jgi:hypothetical protein